MMKNFGRITSLVGLAMLGNAASVYAQPTDRFHRVTTTAQSDTRAASNRDVRSSSARDLRSGSTANRVALASRASVRRSSTPDSAELHPYTARAEAERQDRESNGGQYSTWRQEPEPVAKATPAVSPPRSHTYYPGLRSGVGPAQPVRLTTTPFMPTGRCCMSRSQAMGGGAGMAHHR